ncbi:MAG: gliding motility-associated C-terminal domain-containing protein [Janthinobacterium lividum]
MRLLATLLFCLLGQAAAAQQPSSPAAQPDLEFIENRGQWPAAVRYRAALPGGGQLFAEADGLRLALLADGALAHPGGHEGAGHRAAAASAVAPSGALRAHAFDLRFVGAAPTAHPVAAGRTAEHRNFFQGSDPAHWAADVRSYRTLDYSELWPGVGAHFYENDQQRLEYDFTVAPGADPAAIGVRHAGAEVVLDAGGNLVLTTSVGIVRELAPQAWQTDAAGVRRPVACRYALSAGGTVRFALGNYDRALPLTIDPTVVFATYTGSTATNWGFTATYDAQGNLYSGGIAFSLGYPASPGAYQTTFAGIIDMALIKYDVTKSGPAARAWATYVGGSQGDFPHSLVTNAQGELLVLGSTGSANFPTTNGAVQRTFAGGPAADPFGDAAQSTIYQVNGSDIVVCRLSASGAALQASTYLGGSNNDGLLPLNPYTATPQLAHNYGDPFRGDILTDAAGNVYIASSTSSTNFPVARGFQSTYRGGTSDGVVCKLNAGLTDLLWGSYLGGSASDATYSLQLEPATGDVYVAGGTLSADLPGTTGALNPRAFGNVDGFAARIAASGTSLVRTTYLGTSAYDQAYFLQLGGDGGVYVFGQTLGAYPTTSGLYGNANGRQFIHKLDANLTRTQLATVFGSGRTAVDIVPTAFLVDRCDRVYVSGWGGPNNGSGSSSSYLYANLGGNTVGLPTTAYAVQPQTDGADFYLAQFSSGLTTLSYGTFFGGSEPEHVDGGTSRFDPRGVIYQAVCACFSNRGFPVPMGANYYADNTGSPSTCNNAAFVLNFQPDIADVGPPQTVCTNGPTPLVGTPAGGVWTGPGVSGSPAAGYLFTPPGPGTYPLTYTVTTGQCVSSATRQVTAVAPLPVAIGAGLLGSYCSTNNAALPVVALVGTPAGGTFSGAGVGRAANGTDQVFDPNMVTTGSATITYTYTVGCPATATRQVLVTKADAGPDQTVCVGFSPIFLQGNPAGGTWSGPGVSGSVAAGFLFTPSSALAGTVSLLYTRSAADNSCAATDERRITVVDATNLVLNALPTPLCVGNATRYPLSANTPGGYWMGPGVSRDANGDYYFVPATAGVGTFFLSYVVGISTPCPAQKSLAVTVSSTLNVSLPADTLLCPGTQRPVALRGGLPTGGTWAGPGVSGSAATGFYFTPPAGFAGSASLVYTVAVGGCTGTATRRVGVAPVPSFQPAWVPVACVQDRQAPLVVRFSDASGNPGTRWDFGDGSPAATGATVQHTYQQAGRYQPSVSLRYLNAQCETTAPLAAIEVQNQVIPNVITPNGDGSNQYFRLPPSCAPQLQLFSRWGQQVYQAAAYQNDWDATGQAAGTYYYLLTYPDGRRLKGWLEVIK